MLGTFTFWKLQKFIPSKKNQSVLTTKIFSRKIQILPIHKNKLLQKFCATR